MEQDDLSNYKLIGTRIKETRIEKKMSQAELAEASNISLPHISNIERGKSNMMLYTFINISKALNVSADYLLQPIYYPDFSTVLQDCSQSELDSILKIISELMNAMRTKHKNND